MAPNPPPLPPPNPPPNPPKVDVGAVPLGVVVPEAGRLVVVVVAGFAAPNPENPPNPPLAAAGAGCVVPLAAAG